ncbi:MAG TPA: aldo/keto reductase, partial [Chthoniobacterales bacterium]|nr:aldo/keto reductase [Chthoniobacterales bacterium]
LPIPGTSKIEHLEENCAAAKLKLTPDEWERIDLYQLHRIDPKVPMEDSLGALKQMQDAGKIRHVGLSEVSPEEIARARNTLPIASAQNHYNFAEREWENTLAYCEREGLGFLPWFPVGGGNGLTAQSVLERVAKAHHASAYEVALAWLLERSPVMLPIPGTSKIEHLEENCAAAKLKLTPDEWERIDALAHR